MSALRTLLASAVFVSLSTATLAADVDDGVGFHDWSGAYVGAQFGYAFGDFELAVDGIDDTGSMDGVAGGLHAGYLWQHDSLVIGLEGDVQGLDLGGSLQGGPGNFADLDHNIATSARLRAGVAFDRALIYAAGGVAMGGVDFTTSNAGGSDTSNEWHVGYTVGGGIDFAVTEAISARVEYRYTDLGSQGFTSTVFPANSFNAGLDFHTVQVGLSLHF